MHNSAHQVKRAGQLSSGSMYSQQQEAGMLWIMKLPKSYFDSYSDQKCIECKMKKKYSNIPDVT